MKHQTFEKSRITDDIKNLKLKNIHKLSILYIFALKNFKFYRCFYRWKCRYCI